MNAYSVDAHGNVVKATKNVEAKVRELMIAQEDLIIAKIFAARHLPDSTTVAQTATKSTRITRIRKYQLLNRWQQTHSTATPSFTNVWSFIKNLTGISEFNWCADVSEYGVRRMVEFIKSNSCK